jgi:hypothetical protein
MSADATYSGENGQLELHGHPEAPRVPETGHGRRLRHYGHFRASHFTTSASTRSWSSTSQIYGTYGSVDLPQLEGGQAGSAVRPLGGTQRPSGPPCGIGIDIPGCRPARGSRNLAQLSSDSVYGDRRPIAGQGSFRLGFASALRMTLEGRVFNMSDSTGIAIIAPFRAGLR